MSVKATAWALEQRIGNHQAKLILIAIADFADNRGECFPSQSSLAVVAECSVDTVQRHLKRLETSGFISRERRHTTNGNRTSDRYRVLVDGERSQNEDTTSGGLSRNLRSRPKPQDAVLTKPQAAAETKPQSSAAGTFTEPPKLTPPVSPESEADRANREAYQRGLAIKCGTVAKSARAIQRSRGELDGRCGIRFGSGKLEVFNGSAAALFADFPGVDLAEVCDRAGPEVSRLSYPTADDAMAVLRKWARIVKQDMARRSGPEAKQPTTSDQLRQIRAIAGPGVSL